MFPVVTACGIDDAPYLSPVPLSDVQVSSNTTARVNLDSTGEDEYSPSFLLYYKIYISKESSTSTILPDNMNSINATLGSNYRSILPYTTTSTSTPQIFTPTVFSGMKFYTMSVGSLESLPGETGSITIYFSNMNDEAMPSLAYYNKTGTLYRSTGGGSFTPLPENDRRFRNFTDLRDTQNNDVEQLSGGDYAYCAVYIIKRGINPNTLTSIYSAPTFVAVFRLPDRY
jgi:hypothetical protein